ncbi:hypothetical protein HY405_01595 [Candidatus Microgenomates bacterium]|nr:hypothetical protein [Candidatus Microgenomates bacterium]
MQPTDILTYLESALTFMNVKGHVGVSLDSGKTLFNHLGRKMAVDENVWTEAGEGVNPDDMTEAQLNNILKDIESQEAANTNLKKLKEADAKKKADRDAWLRSQEGLRWQAEERAFQRDMLSTLRLLSKLIGYMAR